MIRLTPRESAELLKGTPMKTESLREQEARENAHRALPQDQQPYMVVIFGMLDYWILWIGEPGGDKADAEKELAWWRSKVNEGIEILPVTRDPSRGDFQVRQQWDLDSLTAAIRRGYER